MLKSFWKEPEKTFLQKGFLGTNHLFKAFWRGAGNAFSLKKVPRRKYITQMQKKVIAVHDISCVGRCSITVALPVISAAGIECSIIPTALLSTHTGGFTGFTFLPLTEEMDKICSHLKTLGRPANAVYTGYLGSPDQIGAATAIIEGLLAKGGTAIVDPVMGDGGRLYAGFDSRMVDAMRELCGHASVIMPNITEASFLLDRPCPDTPPVPGEETEALLRELSILGAKSVILTGVHSDNGMIGAAYYDSVSGEIGYAMSTLHPGFYHGTGDVFGSAFTAAYVLGKGISAATKAAVDFTGAVVKRTAEEGDDKKYGPVFEPLLGDFAAMMK